MSDTNSIVQKLWSYCTVLRDDGLSYQDYLEQLTTLLFLKMADERAEQTSTEQPIPKGVRWSDLSAPKMEGVKLEEHYQLDRSQKKHLRYDALRGVELVEGVGRLCAMNLFLHGIGPDDAERAVPIDSGQDSLRTAPAHLVEVVLTNPPFGKKSSITV